MSAPVFAIVGHPNKGKSSIVATLARDDTVAISPLPGTTVENREYPMRIDEETLYILVDTPGFQRARAALEWMRQQEASAVERPEVVRRFVEQHRADPRFTAECQLLAPILAGGGILYVVDGSRPFGPEYEAEMEILRWTGQPSMALINQIGAADYSESWQRALGQFFRIVRVFNAMTADFDKRIRLLRAFGEISESWRAPMSRAVQVLETEQAERRRLAARTIAEAIGAMLAHTRERRLPDTGDQARALAELRKAYRQELIAMEQACRREVEAIYDYRHLERHEPVMELLDEDLFATRTWRLFGLTRQQLVATGGLGGAAAGGAVDIAVAGHSLLLGAGIGALIGGVSAWIGADRIADTKVMGHPLGGQVLSVGPMRNLNFPYVALGRALLHHELIGDRTHAYRGPLDLQTEAPPQFSAADRKRLEKVFRRLRRRERLAPELLDELSAAIGALMPDGLSGTPRSETSGSNHPPGTPPGGEQDRQT